MISCSWGVYMPSQATVRNFLARLAGKVLMEGDVDVVCTRSVGFYYVQQDLGPLLLLVLVGGFVSPEGSISWLFQRSQVKPPRVYRSGSSQRVQLEWARSKLRLPLNDARKVGILFAPIITIARLIRLYGYY